MTNPIDRFEQELRAIVGRTAKTTEYEERIQEICGHFADVFHEAMSQGMTEMNAEQVARGRLGTPSHIALQMLANPGRISKGLKMQRIALWGYIGAMFASQILTYCALNHWLGIPLMAFAILSIAIFFYLGLMLGIGVMLAGRLLWKTALVIWPISMGIIAACTYVMMPLYMTYRPVGAGTGHLFLSPQFYIFYAFDSSTRMIVIFGALATIAFLIARIWTLRLRWFRLERSR